MRMMLEFMPASIAQRRHTVRKGLREFENMETFAERNGIPTHVERGNLFVGCEALDQWERRPFTHPTPPVKTRPTPPVQTARGPSKVYRNPLDAKRNYVVDTREITVNPFPWYPSFSSGPKAFKDNEFGF